MKSLLYTLFIISGVVLAYDYYGAPPGRKLIFKSLNPPAKPKKIVTEKPVEAEKPVIMETVPTKPAMVEQPKPVEQAPAPASTGPKFEPIEALTGNWLKIPASAFPREVKLLQEATFKMSVGASKIAAGGKVLALGAVNGMLTLAPTAASSARAQQPIDGTDLKAQLNAAYDKWKIARTAELKDIALKKSLSSSAPQTAGPSSSEVDTAGKPVRDSSGAYPLLIAGMKSGQVTEIKPENVLSWNDPQPVTIQGKPGWAVKMECNVKTIFGLQPVEAQALVLNGRITGWYYTGSGEEVP